MAQSFAEEGFGLIFVFVMIRSIVLLGIVFVIATVSGYSQRQYASSSVLSSGNWLKIAVKEAGIYKVEASSLTPLGAGAGGISSSSIRLYGNGGAILGEQGNADYIDDLFENAIQVVDGGDGIFNNNDYFLFYSNGSGHWQKDSAQQSFRFIKNLYSDSAFYYISIGGIGKRIQEQNILPVSTVTVTSFQERAVVENDLVNLIGSGKEWYGEKFTVGSLSRTFSLNWPNVITQTPFLLRASFASRNVGASASMLTTVNGTQSTPLIFPSVTGTFLDRYAVHQEQEQLYNAAQSSTIIRFDYQSAASGAESWLNRFELFGRRALIKPADQVLLFRDWSSVSNGAVARYELSGATNGIKVWDITSPFVPVAMRNLSSSNFIFHQGAGRLREYVAFTDAQALTPVVMGTVSNQNLHGLSVPEYLIITHPSFVTAAQRLATFHRQQYARTVAVISTEQVYQEFGSGIADPTAIRNFVKMLYDKNNSTLQYLLLFGSGSYDPRNRVANNYRFIPTHQSNQSLDPISSYTSDDFFGMLNDTVDINLGAAKQALDIAVGRMPARNLTEANTMVDKIIGYHHPSGFGEWRNRLLFIADDRDQNLHLNDAEGVSAVTKNTIFQTQKIYLDAFPLVSGSGGARYPAVNEAIVNRMNQGALIVNYSGHGNHIRLADEAVFTTEEAGRLQNASRLPLVVTASCDFYPFDDPAKNALGAQMLSGDSTGAIALLTTARLVLAASNRIINEYFIQEALQRDPSTQQYLSLGEAFRRAKNLAVIQSGEILNSRKFVLLGDPAMRLSYPTHRVQLTAVNGRPVTTGDTLQASTRYILEGQITDASGNRLRDFTGTMETIIQDKPQSISTLANESGSFITRFEQQSAILFKGVFSVDTGRFRIEVILPKDVSFQPGKGKISFYAYDAFRDASGADTNLVIVGSDQLLTDRTGPVIRLFLNDTRFKNGGLTHETPMLIAQLSDSSGINTSGNGVGHDITLIIDNEVRNQRVLNDLFVADRDSWSSGSLQFRLPVQSNGAHQLRLKAWDGANNSTEAVLDYVVVKQEQLKLSKVMNFPNPFFDRTRFSFEHNQPNTDLKVDIYIYQSSGRLVKRISKQLNTAGTRNIQIEWDGRDESGRKIQKAVYIYNMVVQSGTQKSFHAGQLILL